jgi:hypothetical protein
LRSGNWVPGNGERETDSGPTERNRARADESPDAGADADAEENDEGDIEAVEGGEGDIIRLLDGKLREVIVFVYAGDSNSG